MPEPLTADPIEPPSHPEPRSRRALLAGGLGGLAGLVAGALTRPLAGRAAAGDPLILGSTTNSSGSAGTKVISSVNGNAFAVSQTGAGSSANGIRGDARDGTGGVFTSTNNNALFATVANPNRSAIVAVNAAAAEGTGQAAYFDGGANEGLEVVTAGTKSAIRATAQFTANGGAGVQASGRIGLQGDGVVHGVFGTGPVAVRGEGSSVGVGGIGGITGVNASGATHGVVANGGTYGVVATGTLVAVQGTGPTGVLGVSNTGWGVRGTSTSGPAVLGASNSGTGVHGVSTNGIGVFGTSPTNWSGYFEIDARVENDFQVGGNASVAGSLSKGGGAFRIDHPLDPANRYLQHSFVESPDMLNVYGGTVTTDAAGEASIRMPDWFEALNRDVRYQLTPIGAAMPDLHVSRELQDLRFGIAGATPGSKVCWQLTGIRQDAWAEANRIAVELDKPEAERGRYLHPAEHGQATSRGIGHALHERAVAGVGAAVEVGDFERPSRT